MGRRGHWTFSLGRRPPPSLWMGGSLGPAAQLEEFVGPGAVGVRGSLHW